MRDDTVPLPPSPPPLVALRQMVNGFRVSQAIYVAAKLGIADVLHEGALGGEALAARVGADARALKRLLRLLVHLGVLAADGDRYRLTPLGAYLRSDVPGSLRQVAMLYLQEDLWR